MQELIKPLDIPTLKSELSKIRFIRTTDYVKNEIYEFENQDSPELMKEIGRLRERTFRASGGGTGLSCDLDYFDLCENPFKQLIIWNPVTEEIIGGYRYQLGKNITVKDNGEMLSPAGELFNFSPHFHEKYTPYMLELGRSFVIPEYQATGNVRKGISALNSLWVGIGSIIAENLEQIKYLFGKFTMYRSYNTYARDLILRMLEIYFPDNEHLCTPKESISRQYPNEMLDQRFKGDNFDEDFKTLIGLCKQQNENIPPLVSSYTNLTPTMKYFGTSLNPGFGDVEESGILITIDDISKKMYDRYITSSLQYYDDHQAS